MWVQIAFQKQEVKALFNTLPYNSFPASSEKFNEGKNDAIQAEIDAIKDGTNIDSFGDVETALATKTNLSNIAPTFDAESGVYEIGEQVIYEGVLYEFTSAHSTAGDWDSSEVQAVKISELIDTLKSGLMNVSTYTDCKGTSQTSTLDNVRAVFNSVTKIVEISGYISDVSFVQGLTVIDQIVTAIGRPIVDTAISIFTTESVNAYAYVTTSGNLAVNSDTSFSGSLFLSGIFTVG